MPRLAVLIFVLLLLLNHGLILPTTLPLWIVGLVVVVDILVSSLVVAVVRADAVRNSTQT